MSLRDVPWRVIQRLHRTIRDCWFTKAKPNSEPLVVRATEHDLLQAFGGRSFAPNWEFSYSYRGEDLNLARVVYEPTEFEAPERIEWWQTHLRGWCIENSERLTFDAPTWELRAHWEPEPTEHPTAHLEGAGFDRERAMDTVRDIATESDRITIAE